MTSEPVLHFLQLQKHVEDKKVLPECKRHTARRVASAYYADLSLIGGGRGYFIQSWMGAPWGTTAPSRPGTGSPPPPHSPDLGWGPPHLDLIQGIPPLPSRPGMGYPPSRPGTGYPPPPHQV